MRLTLDQDIPGSNPGATAKRVRSSTAERGALNARVDRSSRSGLTILVKGHVLKDKAEYNAYMRKYMKDRYHARRRATIVLLGGKCVKCGKEDGLEVDHVDRTQKKLKLFEESFSEERFQQELQKCQLLCKSCHDEKSAAELGKQMARGTHGTLSSYRYCHCELCRAAKNKWTRDYRAKKRTERARSSAAAADAF